VLRLHLERLPAYAPELHADEGLWQPLTGAERRVASTASYAVRTFRSLGTAQ
jgi:hypothetical protein